MPISTGEFGLFNDDDDGAVFILHEKVYFIPSFIYYSCNVSNYKYCKLCLQGKIYN